MPRYSWRKNKDRDGMMRRAASYTLRRDGEELATAQQHRDGSWFWYGDSQNTSHRPDTLEKVKAEAVKHFKAKG